ncbi:4848_t:CDS:2, partial [Dentiscutata erythropus]
FFKQRNENYPLIATYEGEFINPFYCYNSKALEISIIKELIVEYEEEYEIENNNEQEVYYQNLNHLNNVLDKLQNVYSNFKPLEKMIDDIETLENRHTIPRTFKDFNHNTLYWD